MIRNGGIKQSSEKEYKNAKGIYKKPKFWKDLVLVATGGFVIWLISVLWKQAGHSGLFLIRLPAIIHRLDLYSHATHQQWRIGHVGHAVRKEKGSIFRQYQQTDRPVARMLKCEKTACLDRKPPFGSSQIKISNQYIEVWKILPGASWSDRIRPNKRVLTTHRLLRLKSNWHLWSITCSIRSARHGKIRSRWTVDTDARY